VGAPICEICLKTGILCSNCENRLERGEITKLDVEVAKLLYQLGTRFKGLKDVDFKKAIEIEDMVILLIRKGGAGTLIGKGGKIVKSISKKLDKRVRIIEDSKSNRGIAQDLLSPVRVLGINILFLPDGREKFKIVVPKRDASRLPSTVTALQNILKYLTGKEMIISFE
jgi:transcription antitermination factor NusA-like protein